MESRHGRWECLSSCLFWEILWMEGQVGMLYHINSRYGHEWHLVVVASFSPIHPFVLLINDEIASKVAFIQLTSSVKVLFSLLTWLSKAELKSLFSCVQFVIRVSFYISEWKLTVDIYIMSSVILSLIFNWVMFLPWQLFRAMFCPFSIQVDWIFIENGRNIAQDNFQGKKITLIGGYW